jgi:acyl-CoA synthetase (AMP-forming)/AMP-acid ligase II
VRANTIEGFAEAFARYGLSPEALRPCYGLAEATLLASCSKPSRAPVIGCFDRAELACGRAVPAASGAGVRLVSCGQAAAGHAIQITSSDDTPTTDGQVGEIWLRGPSVASGYWALPGISNDVFRVTGGVRGRFLRTGDLGFVLRDELYITGRLKDLITLNGRNIYPQDIEFTVQSLLNSAANSCAAFIGEEPDDHSLVIVQELRAIAAIDVETVARRIVAAVADEHGVRPGSVILIRAGHLPKTTSGKVRRAAARKAITSGELALLGQYRGSNAPGTI